MFLKNRNISSKIKRSKVTDYAALIIYLSQLHIFFLFYAIHLLSVVSDNKYKIFSLSTPSDRRESMLFTCMSLARPSMCLSGQFNHTLSEYDILDYLPVNIVKFISLMENKVEHKGMGRGHLLLKGNKVQLGSCNHNDGVGTLNTKRE